MKSQPGLDELPTRDGPIARPLVFAKLVATAMTPTPSPMSGTNHPEMGEGF